MEYKIEEGHGYVHHSIYSVDPQGIVKHVVDIPRSGDPTISAEQEICHSIRTSNLIMAGEDMLNALKEVLPLLKACENYTPVVNRIANLIAVAESKELIIKYYCSPTMLISLKEGEEKRDEAIEAIEATEETEEEETESSVPSTHTEFMLEDLYRVVGDLQKFNRKLLNALIAPAGQQRSNLETLRKELPKEGK